MGPAVPPVVTFRDGLLTVQALNSSLSSVLTAIRNKTGIEFEGAENVSERVAISLGPAPEGEVLSAILAGPKYDFVAIGRPDSPGIVQRVIIKVKNKSGAVAETTQPQPRPANGQEGDEEDTPDEQPTRRRRSSGYRGAASTGAAAAASTDAGAAEVAGTAVAGIAGDAETEGPSRSSEPKYGSAQGATALFLRI